MNKIQKAIIIAMAAIGVAAVVAVFFLPPPSEQLRKTLANAFNRPMELIHLNLPPASGRYPGAVVLAPRPEQVLPLRRVSRPDQIPEHTTTLQTKMESEAKAALASRFFGSSASSGDLVVDITLDDLRLFEVDLDGQFKKELIEDEDVYRAEKRGSNPQVIVRAYEAIMSLNVQRAKSLSAEIWMKARKKLEQAAGDIVVGDTITFRGDYPTVIAYETMSLNYIATSLSGGGARELKLRNARAVNVAADELDISAFNLTTGTSNVRYALLGNSRYKGDKTDKFDNLDAVEPSIQIMESVFHGAGANPLFAEQLPNVLNESTMKDAISRITEKLRTTNPSLFVLYYVGHGVTGIGGQLYLVMDDYSGKGLDEDFLLGLPRVQMDEPTSPLSGSNFSELANVVVALAAEAPAEVKGLYPVSMIAKQLEETGIPFVIIVDVCFEHEQMDSLRDALHLTKSGDYYGPDTYGGAPQVIKYSEAIRQFSASPYLRSTNVIIFSATPGTAALVVQDPRPAWGDTQHVGPLARRIRWRFYSAVAASEPLTWGDFLQSVIDVNALGEVRIRGTISWSDFSVIRQLPMLQNLL